MVLGIQTAKKLANNALERADKDTQILTDGNSAKYNEVDTSSPERAAKDYGDLGHYTAGTVVRGLTSTPATHLATGVAHVIAAAGNVTNAVTVGLISDGARAIGALGKLASKASNAARGREDQSRQEVERDGNFSDTAAALNGAVQQTGKAAKSAGKAGASALSAGGDAIKEAGPVVGKGAIVATAGVGALIAAPFAAATLAMSSAATVIGSGVAGVGAGWQRGREKEGKNPIIQAIKGFGRGLAKGGKSVKDAPNLEIEGNLPEGDDKNAGQRVKNILTSPSKIRENANEIRTRQTGQERREAALNERIDIQTKAINNQSIQISSLGTEVNKSRVTNNILKEGITKGIGIGIDTKQIDEAINYNVSAIDKNKANVGQEPLKADLTLSDVAIASKAATKLQKNFREKQSAKQEAATTIQKFGRGYNAKKEAEGLRQEVAELQRSEAATTIQAAVREKIIEPNNKAAETIQTAVREKIIEGNKKPAALETVTPATQTQDAPAQQEAKSEGRRGLFSRLSRRNVAQEQDKSTTEIDAERPNLLRRAGKALSNANLFGKKENTSYRPPSPLAASDDQSVGNESVYTIKVSNKSPKDIKFNPTIAQIPPAQRERQGEEEKISIEEEMKRTQSENFANFDSKAALEAFSMPDVPTKPLPTATLRVKKRSASFEAEALKDKENTTQKAFG